MNKLLLTIGAIGTAVYFAFKRHGKADAPDPLHETSPFGTSGCELHVDAARIVVERDSRPVYEGMRHTILAADPESGAWKTAFLAAWTQVTEAGMVQFSYVINERQCSAGDYDRAYNKYSGLVACMMLKDLSLAGHVDEEPRDIVKACALDPADFAAQLSARLSMV